MLPEVISQVPMVTTQAFINPMIEEIRRLGGVADELEGVLRSHQRVLQQKGMRLPEGVLSSVQQLHTEMGKLAQQIEDQQTEVHRLRALGDTTHLINSTLELDDVLNAVMDTVIRLTGAERGYLVLRNEETKELDFRVARNIERRNLDESESIISRTIVSEVAQTGVPVVTTNAAQDTRFSAQQSVVSFALRSILCVPLILKSEVTGVIYADNRIRAGLFGDKELQLLYAFANQAAIAIENARLYEQLRASLAEITAMRDLMNNVFASIASGVITTDTDDNIMIVNNAAGRILNIDLSRCTGRIVWDVLPVLRQGFDRLFQAVREQSLEETIDLEPEIPERGLVNLSLKLSPLRTGEQVTQGVAIVVDDLTELKQREAQLKVIQRYLTPAMVDNIRDIDRLGLGGERRLITTIFIDVRGLPTFPASMPPRELMETLNVYLTIAADAVTQQNGVIDKYMANEIMGLFNTQLNPEEDHAWRAVQTALNMAVEYCQFYQLSGEPEGRCYYRVGIHTGMAVLGNAGSETRKEFTAIGDSINTAHRLLENADQGEIVISEATYEHCQQQFADHADEIQIAGPMEILVKGKRQPVKIYRVRYTTIPTC